MSDSKAKSLSHKEQRQEKKEQNKLATLDDHSRRIIEVRKIVKQRDEVRIRGEFTKSDELRQKLESLGVEVVDQKNGPSGWKFKDGSSNKLPAGVTYVPEEATKKRKLNEEQEQPAAKAKKVEKKESKESKPTEGTKQQQSAEKVAKKPVSLDEERDRVKAALKKVLGDKPEAVSSKSGGKVRVVNGVTIEELEEGTGLRADSGKKITVHYIGRLKSNNKVFDASKNRPFTFKLGRGEVIRGWDIGCEGMKVGGKRKLTIPPEKAYGKVGALPTIPPNSTLVFDVSLVQVK